MRVPVVPSLCLANTETALQPFTRKAGCVLQVTFELGPIPDIANTTWTNILGSLSLGQYSAADFGLVVEGGYELDVCDDKLCSEQESASGTCLFDCPSADVCPGAISLMSGSWELRLPVLDRMNHFPVPRVRCELADHPFQSAGYSPLFK